MHIHELEIPGAFKVIPDQLADIRGPFYEGFRVDLLRAATGRDFVPEQINYSASRRNTLRGIHGVLIPPGQAKYVTCVRGALLDVVVDIRVGSPTFGRHVATRLDSSSGTAVFVPEKLGHGFLALEDDSCICYVLSSTYVPGTQFEINPLDPDLALPWGATEQLLLSEKDANARTLQQAIDAGILPYWKAG